METIGDPKKLLAGWEKVIVEIVQRLREELHKIDANIVETVGRTTFNYQRKQLFAYIWPYEEAVNLGFHSGGGMADPQKRMQGSGKYNRYLDRKSVV